jgi:hypothetical protein
MWFVVQVGLAALFGCSASEADSSGPSDTSATPGTPTWYADVAPIVGASCQGCHTAGGIAPFALDTPEEGALWAEAMVAAVESGRMPPWSAAATDACTPRFGWKDDLRLSDTQRATLRAWADAGAPAGDPATAAPLPQRAATELDRVDARIAPEVGYATSGDADEYICYSIDPGFTETKWLTGFQIEPGLPAAVHHVLVFADPDGVTASLANEDGYYPCFGGVGGGVSELVGAWAPGMTPLEMPPGIAEELPAGSRLVMQVHYHPNGTTQPPDRTAMAVRFADAPPDRLTQLRLIGNFGESPNLLPGPNDPSGVAFLIPANVAGHTEEMRYKYRGSDDVPLWIVGTHMHYIGRGMRIMVEHAAPSGDEPATECLIETPTWDFNWQRLYAYDAPLDAVPRLHRNDVLQLSCTYDNTTDNPGVRQALADAGLAAPVDVRLGEATLDEMCLGVFGVVVDR